MKHKFSKKWLALLLGAFVVVAAMIPMLTIGTKSATESINLYANTGSFSNKVITWTSSNFTFENAQSSSATAIRVSDSDHYRMYGKSEVTITALNENNISKVVFTTTASGNYATVLQTSVNNNNDSNLNVTVNGKLVTITMTEPVKSLSFTMSAQSRVNKVEVELAAACAHENIVAVGTPSDATCTDDGITAGEKCADCGKIIVPQEPIEATGHIDENGDSKCDTCGTNLCTEHVWVDGEVITEGDCTTNRVVAQVCEKCGEPGEDKVITAPGHTPVVDEEIPSTCTSTGKTEGSHCGECGEILEAQTTTPIAPHDFVNNVCTVCGTSGQEYVKVTTAPTDWTGTYLIVYEEGNLAFNGSIADKLDVTFNTFDVTIDEGKIIGDFSANAFIIEAVDGGYAIKSASGRYIGKTSGGNGMNEHTSTKYINTISLDASGNADITASGGSIIRFNKAVDQMRFRYYGSGQQPVALYKLVEAVPEPEFKGFGVTLDKAVTVRVKFNVTAEWIAANPTAKVTFSNGTVCDLDENKSYYTTTLTPGQIGNDLTVTLGDITETVSVSTYIEKAKAANATDTTLCALLDAIEVYGKAAARVEQTLTDLGLTGVEDYKVEQNESIISGFDNVTLGQYANIGIKFEKNEDYIYVAKLGDISLGRRVLANDLDTNNVLLIENLFPANFDDVITVTVYEGDTSTVVSTMTFTFNSYLKEASKKETIDDLDLNMIFATYNYGVAAEAYVDAHQQS